MEHTYLLEYTNDMITVTGLELTCLSFGICAMTTGLAVTLILFFL